MVSLGIMTSTERQYGILKRLGATPLPRAVLIFGKIVAISMIVAAAVIVLIALGIAFRTLDVVGSITGLIDAGKHPYPNNSGGIARRFQGELEFQLGREGRGVWLVDDVEIADDPEHALRLLDCDLLGGDFH